MTIDEAIHKMEYSKRAYQMLIDEGVQKGELVGKGIKGEWESDTPIIDAYKDMLDACDMSINALERIDKISKACERYKKEGDNYFGYIKIMVAEDIVKGAKHERIQ